MANGFRAALIALLIGCSWCLAPQAAELRVHNAEPISLKPLVTTGTQKTGTGTTLFSAFGRNFELVLEDNSRLLRKADPLARDSLGAVTLLRGTLKDVPGSWVRLSIHEGVYEGAIWDGSEFYAIESRAHLSKALQGSTSSPSSGSLIYKLSDTEGGLTSEACALDASAPLLSNTPLGKYRDLIEQLKSVSAAKSPREIEISVIADYEFTIAHPDALLLMATWLNVVDGMFGEQVGIAIVPTDFITFPANDDPFTTTSPDPLLNEVAGYRAASPSLQSRGISHLITGRNLVGNIVGLAFLGSICDDHSAVSLSQGSYNMDSALIIAHEFGHLFGAPHDGVDGSACAATPANFLMSPNLNGSRQFSSCSLQRMQPVIAGATCIGATQIRDVSISAPAPVASTIVNQSLDIPFDISSVGAAAAANVTVSSTLPYQLSLVSASIPGGFCTVNGGSFSCMLPVLAPGETRRATIRTKARLAGDVAIQAFAASSNDSDATNNVASVAVGISLERDLQITLPPKQSVVSGEPFNVTVAVTSSGGLEIPDVRWQLSSSTKILAASVANGTCAVASNNLWVTCELGSMPPGTTKEVHLQMVSQSPGSDTAYVAASAQSTQPSVSKSGSFTFETQAAHAVALSVSQESPIVAINVDAALAFNVKSSGKYSVADVKLRLETNAVVLAVDGEFATACTVSAGVMLCNLGTMPPDTQYTIPVRVRSGQPLYAQIQARIEMPTADDTPRDNAVSTGISIRYALEVGVNASTLSSRDEIATSARLIVHSLGAYAAQSVTVSIQLPTSFTIHKVSVANGTCSTQASLASCAIAQMPVGSESTIQMEYTAATVGTFAGTINVAADGDADATNNSQPLTLLVYPAIDGRLIVPNLPAFVFAGQSIEVPLQIVSNRYALTDARLTFTQTSSSQQMPLPTMSQGTCRAGERTTFCELGVIPPNTTFPITLHVPSAVAYGFGLQLSLYAASEMNGENNQGVISMRVYTPGDVTAVTASNLGAATVAQSFSLPIDLKALSAVENAFLEIDVDPARMSTVRFSSTNSCKQTGNVIRCESASIPAGQSQRITITFVPVGEGPLNLALRTGAINDTEPSNNQQVASLTVNPAPAPPTPPVQPPPVVVTPAEPAPVASAPKSSGGGGSFDVLSMLLVGVLVGLEIVARRRRESAGLI